MLKLTTIIPGIILAMLIFAGCTRNEIDDNGSNGYLRYVGTSEGDRAAGLLSHSDGPLGVLFTSVPAGNPPLVFWNQLNTAGLAINPSVNVTGDNTSIATDLLETTEGNLVYCGMGADGSMAGLVLTKFDVAGVITWQTTFQNGEQIVPVALAGNTEGEIFVLGQTSDLDDTDVILLKYNPNGSLIWTRRIVEGDKSDEAMAMVYFDGFLYLLVRSQSFVIEGTTNTLLLRASADGGILDRALNLYDGVQNDFGFITMAEGEEALLIAGEELQTDRKWPCARKIGIHDFSTLSRYTDTLRQGAYCGAIILVDGVFLIGNKDDESLDGAFISQYSPGGDMLAHQTIAGSLTASRLTTDNQGKLVLLCTHRTPISSDISILAFTRPLQP